MTSNRLPFDAPYGCAWCGVERSGHGRRWSAIVGQHPWKQPSQDKIKDRMTRRREARLFAEPPRYHATTAWAPDHTGEEGIPYCADCRTDVCRPWLRIQDRLDRQRWGLPRTTGETAGGWDADALMPF